MSYQVVLSYDLRNASSDDYECVTESLNSIGYENELDSTDGKVETPSTTFRKVVSGSNSTSIRDSERQKVKGVMRKCGVSSFFMVFVGGSDHTWGSTGT